MNTNQVNAETPIAWRKVETLDSLKEGMVICLGGNHFHIECVINNIGDDYDLMVRPITVH